MENFSFFQGFFSGKKLFLINIEILFCVQSNSVQLTALFLTFGRLINFKYF